MTAHVDPGARPGAVRTFLIADIRGYTRFTSERGDDAASRLAALFAEITGQGVAAWGGELIELRGDEALAVFESARQALRAAVELQSAFRDEMRSAPELPLAVGIGLDAGEAVSVGDGYRGAALNLAARLCATAAAGEIRITEGLAHLAGPVDGLEMEPLDPAQFKGITGLVRPILVRTTEPDVEATPPTSHDRESRPLPPELDSMVPLGGRQSELRWLSWHWRRARHGHPRTVVLSGRVGIGKTRLASEVASMARRDGGIVVYRAGESLEDGVTWGDGRTDVPAVHVIDDLDRAPAAALGSLVQGLVREPGTATLSIVTHGEPAPPPVAEAVASLQPTGHLALGPLQADGILHIVRLYAEPGDDAPLALIEAESEGVPAAVHRVASQWARNQAYRRLGSSAQRTASGRRELRSAEAELIADVGGLERARDRTRMFVEDPAQADELRAVCPYKGLAPFESADADYFFGRDRLVSELVAKLVGSSFVAVVGPSGSGKSSVLRAGLLPALAEGILPGSGAWQQVVMRPGTRPLEELRLALARSTTDDIPPDGDVARLLETVIRRLAADGRLVVVVDQFEEVFAVPDADERDRFLDLLTTARPGLKTVVALRADHYGHAAAYPALARLLGTDQVLVGPVRATELAAIVERPAQAVGLSVEAELTTALVADAGEEPGALPLLSTALLELWHARTDDVMTLAAYQARGGVRGAVARLAEAAFGRLTPAQQTVARGVLLRLAGSGVGNTLVRRRVRLAELDTGDDDVGQVLDVLTAQRLLSTGDGYVEVAHEALLREWPRLQNWLEEDAAGRAVRLHLIAAAREWDDAGREAGDLYRGARLAAALDWAADHDPELNPIERAFIGASRDAARGEANRERATNRRLRFLLAGTAVFLVAALGAGGLALVQSQQAQAEAVRADAAADEADRERESAERERESAEREALLNRSRELAASAITQLDTDPTLARLLALSAATVPELPEETVAALRRSLAEDRVLGTYSWPEDRPIHAFAPALHPAGDLIALGGWGSSMFEVIDRESGTVQWSYDAGEGLFLSAPMFSPDGELLAIAVSADGISEGLPAPERTGLFLWRADTGDLVRRLDAGPCGPDLGGLSNRYALIITVPDEVVTGTGSCHDGDWTSGELIELTSGERGLLTRAPQSAALSADGSVVAYDDFSVDPPVSVVAETATGDRLLTLDPLDQSDGLNAFVRALSPTGDLLVYGSRPMRIWDTTRGERIGFFHGHGGDSIAVEFAADGASVYSTGVDSRLRHWDVRTGEEIRSLGPVAPDRVTLSPEMALVTRDGGTAALFDLRPRGEVLAVETCHRFVYAGTLQVVDNLAAIGLDACPDGGIDTVIADLATGTVVREIPEHGSQGIAISPDGTRLVRQEGIWPHHAGLTVRDMQSGAVLVELEGTCAYDTTAERDEAGVSPGCNPLPEPPFAVWPWELIWSPDGEAIVAVNDTQDATGGFAVWDADDGRLRFADPVQVVLSATFTPDGRQLVVATMDDDVPEEERVVAFRRYSASSGQLLDEHAVDGIRGVAFGLGIRFIGYSADSSTLFAIDRPGVIGSPSLVAIDPERLDVVRTRGRLTEGQVKSVSMSPDGSLLAVGSSDGYVRVWNAETFGLAHEIFVADTQVQGVAFISDSHLAVAPENGSIFVYTLNVDELVEIARQSLTRGFTPDECERFNFGDECPTLDELRRVRD